MAAYGITKTCSGLQKWLDIYYFYYIDLRKTSLGSWVSCNMHFTVATFNIRSITLQNSFPPLLFKSLGFFFFSFNQHCDAFYFHLNFCGGLLNGYQGLISFGKDGEGGVQMYRKKVMGLQLSYQSREYILQHLYTDQLFRLGVSEICSIHMLTSGYGILYLSFADLVLLQFTDKIASMLPQKYSQLGLVRILLLAFFCFWIHLTISF